MRREKLSETDVGKFIEAAYNVDISYMKFLLRSNEEISRWKDNKTGITLLHQLAYCNLSEAAMLVIQAGCDINGVTKNGESALHWAVKMQSIDVAKVLTGPSWNKDVHINHTDCSGSTALHYAVSASSPEMVGLLLNSDCTNAKFDNTGNSKVTKQLCDVYIQDMEGRTALDLCKDLQRQQEHSHGHGRLEHMFGVIAVLLERFASRHIAEITAEHKQLMSPDGTSEKRRLQQNSSVAHLNLQLASSPTRCLLHSSSVPNVANQSNATLGHQLNQAMTGTLGSYAAKRVSRASKAEDAKIKSVPSLIMAHKKKKVHRNLNVMSEKRFEHIISTLKPPNSTAAKPGSGSRDEYQQLEEQVTHIANPLSFVETPSDASIVNLPFLQSACESSASPWKLNDVIITVEQCFGCKLHNFSLRHDEEKYCRLATSALQSCLDGLRTSAERGVWVEDAAPPEPEPIPLVLEPIKEAVTPMESTKEMEDKELNRQKAKADDAMSSVKKDAKTPSNGGSFLSFFGKSDSSSAGSTPPKPGKKKRPKSPKGKKKKSAFSQSMSNIQTGADAPADVTISSGLSKIINHATYHYVSALPIRVFGMKMKPIRLPESSDADVSISRAEKLSQSLSSNRTGALELIISIKVKSAFKRQWMSMLKESASSYGFDVSQASNSIMSDVAADVSLEKEEWISHLLHSKLKSKSWPVNSVLQRNASRFVSLIHTAHALAQATFDQRAEEVQMPIAALTLSDPLKVKRSGSAEKSIGIERSLSGASIPENKPFGHHLEPQQASFWRRMHRMHYQMDSLAEDDREIAIRRKTPIYPTCFFLLDCIPPPAPVVVEEDLARTKRKMGKTGLSGMTKLERGDSDVSGFAPNAVLSVYNTMEWSWEQKVLNHFFVFDATERCMNHIPLEEEEESDTEVTPVPSVVIPEKEEEPDEEEEEESDEETEGLVDEDERDLMKSMGMGNIFS